jgi:hypothetical protein
LAFARAACVVDVRHLKGRYRSIEQFYFVYFSNKVGVSRLV